MKQDNDAQPEAKKMITGSRGERTTTSRRLLWLGVLFAMFFWFLVNK